MTKQAISTPVTEDLADLAAYLRGVEALLAKPALQAAVGAGVVREFRYPISSFRARFPDLWPGGQKALALTSKD
jgi:hypothetical protein